MELTGYGRSTGFCVDPIEKKPLNHFLPGSAVLSFGTAGCNLACSFCQNWDISKSREVARLSAHAAPETIARAAERLDLHLRAVPFPQVVGRVGTHQPRIEAGGIDLTRAEANM